MKHRTVQKTLFFSYFIPILITILILSVIFFAYTSRALRNFEESNLADITDKMASIIDSEISKMNNLSLNITSSGLLKEYIREYYTLKNKGYSSESRENYIASRDISNMLATIAGPIKTVPQINFIDPGRLLIGSGTYNLSQKIPAEAEMIIAETDRVYGKRNFSGPLRDPLAETAFPLYKNQSYISLYRTIFDDNGNTPSGIIEVKQFAETIFYGFSKTPKNFLIFDTGFKQLYPYTLDSAHPYIEILKKNKKDGIISFRNPETGSVEILSIGNCHEINWVILNVAEESELLKPVYRFLLIIIISGIVMFIISILVARRLSGYITLSLMQLTGWISNLHWDNLSVETRSDLTELSTLDEFEEIHREFWKMNKKLAESMKLVVRERTLQENARMLALQSQMDPHFMYNMLTTISIMAEDGESDNIVETISHLTFILRYTASRSKLFVPLLEEFEISRSFLKCMKVRFGDDLGFDIIMDEKLKSLEFPKLIILPLVENCMKYATSGEPPWNITVKGIVNESRWEIVVEDSGSGFSTEALKKIEEIIYSCDENAENQLCFHFDGLGLPNIYSRMKLFFGDDFEFKIFNLKNGGACIRMGGPLER